jgi:hypothetical protein
LKRLDRCIEKHPVEAAVTVTDVIPMMLAEGVHGHTPLFLMGYQGRSPWLGAAG